MKSFVWAGAALAACGILGWWLWQSDDPRENTATSGHGARVENSVPGHPAPTSETPAAPASAAVDTPEAGAAPAASAAPVSGSVAATPGASAASSTVANPATPQPPVSPASPGGAPAATPPGTSLAPPTLASLADLLESGVDLSDPAQRERVAAQAKALEDAAKAEALAKAAQMNLPARVTRADGTVAELMRFEGDQPLYYRTHNADAAISSGANLLQAPPYSLRGNDMTVTVWDAGAARPAHEEFSGRVTVRDGSSPDDHATHVAGTIAARGANPQARGMAPSIRINSYDWNNDLSEMTLGGASYPGEQNRVALSNHSYGYQAGWQFYGEEGITWVWFGSGRTASSTDSNFGRYASNSRDIDALAHSLPYYLVIRSAGNDRTDNPATGESVLLSFSGNPTSYNPSSHPQGDGTYRNGYETIDYSGLSKNILTVGAVNDAVNAGVRTVSNASMTNFSSWGPTDDGRIKPDVVGNGASLVSALSSSNTAYGSYSGTSMSSPNVTGTTALLVEFYESLFPGHALRASSLKALLIHTADDLGTAGPDYRTGWGLINGKAAADLMQAYKNQPSGQQFVEDRLTTEAASRSYAFTWNGVTPIKATLSWTDPAGVSTNSSDVRTPTLVNNLDLKITGPDASEHLPYIMPYVGNWTTSALASAAIPGKNNTDNVEQVYLATPPAAGVYTATVTVDGALRNDLQHFSLVLTGGTAAAALPPPTLSAVTPRSGTTERSVITLAGTGFVPGASVTFTRAGETDRTAFGHEITRDSLKCRIELIGLKTGPWNVAVTNPDGQTAMLPNAFNVAGALFEESFEDMVPGWALNPQYSSSNNWGWGATTAAANVYSSTTSFIGTTRTGTATGIADLITPVIEIPFASTSVDISFWHKFSLQSMFRDGGVLEISLNGGAWFDAVAADSGLEFTSGAYDSTIASTNPLGARAGWARPIASYSRVSLSVKDVPKYAGKRMRIRWRLAGGPDATRGLWYLDNVTVAVVVPAVNGAPEIVAAAASTPAAVEGTEAALSVAASDDGGEVNLVYTWSATVPESGIGPSRPASFSENNSNEAKNTTIIFAKAGAYTVSVSVRDVENATATSSVEVSVLGTPSGISISPEEPTVPPGTSLSFSAAVLDQFQDAITPAPALSWTATGGAITSSGVFTAGMEPGPFTVTAALGALQDSVQGMIGGEAGSTLAAWAAQHSIALTSEALLDDPDRDGFANLAEYALGTNPHAATPPLQFSADADFLSLTFQRPAALPDVSYSVESSADLAAWQPVALEVITPGNPETVRARAARPAAPDTGLYMRLKTTRLNAP